MAFLNIVTIPKHIDEIRISENVNFFYLIGFSETRLDKSFSDEDVEIPDFEIIRKDRNRNGGGVCAFLRSDINYRDRKEIVPDEVEAVCLEI